MFVPMYFFGGIYPMNEKEEWYSGGETESDVPADCISSLTWEASSLRQNFVTQPNELIVRLNESLSNEGGDNNPSPPLPKVNSSWMKRRGSI